MTSQPPTRDRKARTGVGVPAQPVKTEYIYHWNRIFGALALLLLFVGLIGFAIYAWLPSPSAPGDTAGEVVDTPVALLDVASESDDQDTVEAAPEAGVEVTPIPDTAMPYGTELPVEENGPADSEAADVAEEGPFQVFLQPDTRVNLRAAPSLTSPVLFILDERAELQLLETSAAFYQVRSAEGIVGWVSRDHSSLEPYPAPGGD